MHNLVYTTNYYYSIGSFLKYGINTAYFYNNRRDVFCLAISPHLTSPHHNSLPLKLSL